jgi:hypothetical protein
LALLPVVDWFGRFHRDWRQWLLLGLGYLHIVARQTRQQNAGDGPILHPSSPRYFFPGSTADAEKFSSLYFYRHSVT